jgi:hypothetical protein
VTRHTPVGPDDLHFWDEVMLPSGDWLVLEPTAGYELPGPNLPWTERLAEALAGAWAWARGHAAGLGLGGAALGCLWWRRRELLDALAVLCWRCFPGRSWRRCVRRVLRLIERRGRWAGRPRAGSQTFPAWLHAALPAGPSSPDLAELLRMAEWAAYAPGLGPPWAEDDVRRVCRLVLGRWTLRRWRRAAAALGQEGA